MADFDVIVIGSGFGGSVMTCRLAEKGYSVCLLERGKEYKFGEFPRRVSEMKKLFWDPKDNAFGIYDVNIFNKSDAAIVAGSGLGGGSLVYGNTLFKMPEDFFKTWPESINRKIMNPYYDKVVDTMEASPYPFDSDPYYNTPKTRLMKEAYKKLKSSPGAIGKPEWMFPDLAVRFKGDFPAAQSKNSHDVTQSRCNNCGGCALGCNILAKNTLDLNYIARAKNQKLLGDKGKAAVIKTYAQVFDIVPSGKSGYVVFFKDPRDNKEEKISSKKVVVSAGSFGSTSLLLKLKDKGSLPNLSDKLGQRWSGNGNLEAFVLKVPQEVEMTVGPAITAAINYRYYDYSDGFPYGLSIEDGGLPEFIAWYLTGQIPSLPALSRLKRFLYNMSKWILGKRKDTKIGGDLASLMDMDNFTYHTMMLLGMGRDRSNGTLYLNKSKEIEVDWEMRGKNELHFKRTSNEMKKIANAMGGHFVENPLSYLDKMIAVHLLGGCSIAENEKEGVVDINGEAFGHPGLYVVDGSIMPTSVGVNPSLTIAAMAEKIAEQFPPAR